MSLRLTTHPDADADGCPEWDAVDNAHGVVDRFGNLALLQSNINAHFSNQPPRAENLRPGERVIYGHQHRGISLRPATTFDSICVCAKWHGWKPLTLAEAIRQMDVVGVA